MKLIKEIWNVDIGIKSGFAKIIYVGQFLAVHEKYFCGL